MFFKSKILFSRHRHIHDIRQWRGAVIHMNIKTFILQGTHGSEPLFFIGPTTANPNFHAI